MFDAAKIQIKNQSAKHLTDFFLIYIENSYTIAKIPIERDINLSKA
jgi:hypothetical protein